jgi:hypothetical protein
MASNTTGSSADRLTHPLLEELGAISAATEGLFVYSAKIVCGKQTDASCCCSAGVRPGVYATEVNIQNLNLVTATVLKFVLPLINSGAIVAREPNVADPATALRGRPVDVVKLPPLGATMDDCCRISELLLGAAPSGEAPLTIAILTIVSQFELAVSVVYTANPLSGDGISIDVEYIPSRILRLRGQG